MTDHDLIAQLKTLKNIRPEQEWVVLTRQNLMEKNEVQKVSASIKVSTRILDLFGFTVPRLVAVPALVAVVAVVGGISVIQEGQIQGESGSNFASVSKIYSLGILNEGVGQELEAIAQEAAPSGEVVIERPQTQDGSYTVIFKKDADFTERFKRMLKDRIEVKIYQVQQEAKDLADEELQRQVNSLLQAARESFAAGELIEALELVTAAEKLSY